MRQTKFGLLCYGTSKWFNIGDYIQSLAAKQYLPKVDILVDRELLSAYSGFDIAMIMNGWFMHNPTHWPPINKITPLYVSLHINSSCEKKMLYTDSIEHFKKFEPIGCRDKRTTELLTEQGVKSYYSGCLTLTLENKYKKSNSCVREEIIFVDPYISFIDKPHNLSSLKNLLLLLINGMPIICTKYKLLSRIEKELYKDVYGIALKSKLLSSKFIYIIVRKLFALIFLSQYSKKFSWEILNKANYVHHVYSSKNFVKQTERYIFAEQLLKRYAEAKLIITSRIHCALPCISFNTPHIYVIHPQDSSKASTRSSSRLNGLTDLFNILRYSEGKFIGISDGKISSDIAIVNNNRHTELAYRLKKSCIDFISKKK